MHRKLLALAIAVLAVGGCASRHEARSRDLATLRDLAEVVSALPGPAVSYREPLRIVFAQDLVPKNFVGQTERRGLVQLRPEPKGDWVWTGRDTLEFRAAAGLDKYRTYAGRLDVTPLLSRKPKSPLPVLEFSFETVGNEVSAFEGEFQPVPGGEKYAYAYSGRVEFTESTTLAAARDGLVLRGPGGAVPLTVDGGANGRRFEFKSRAVRKQDREQDFTLVLKSKPLDLQSDIPVTAVLGKLAAFGVERIDRLAEGDTKGLVITFTDRLSSGQRPDGFVSVTPTVKVSHKPVANKLYVFGDFAYGQTYGVTVREGLKNEWGDVLPAPHRGTIRFEDLKPQVRFTGPGVFLPSSNREKLTFQTVNVRRVKVTALRVFANNLGQFLQTERLGQGDPNDVWDQPSRLRRVGVTAAEKELPIGDRRNVWLTHELDLKPLFDADGQGLYYLSLSFERKDMMYRAESGREPSGDEEDYSWGEDYYTNPAKAGYLQRNGVARMPVILSDLGLTVKRGRNTTTVFANHLVDTRPLGGVTVRLMTYQNQAAAEGRTNADGRADFAGVADEIFYVEGRWNGQRSVVKLSEMAWNLSGYDTGGAEESAGGVRAFTYTDRGVYRPGDTIHLSLIARNPDGGFPDRHPVTLKLRNPKGQLLIEQTQREGRDGFYSFDLPTREKDLTGEWQAELLVGGAVFHHPLRVETVVPNRLKVEVKTARESLTRQERRLDFSLAARYLFGTPGANLKAEVTGLLERREKTFPAFAAFTFSHEGVEYKPVEVELASENLDSAGRLAGGWTLPDLGAAPSALAATLRTRVYDRGGRYTLAVKTLPVDPYARYVGIEKPELEYGTFRIPGDLKVRAVLVGAAGRPAAGRTLRYRIYKNKYWWWWEYRDDAERQLKFKSDRATELAAQGTLISRQQPVPLQVRLEEGGEYLLEVQDGEDGHAAGYFFHASTWGGDNQNKQEAGTILLKADRDRYLPGETARVSFPAPAQGRVLCTVERGSELLSAWWETPQAGRRELTLSVPVTERMVPTAYVSVSVLQPHAQTKNDLPLRLYGVLPLNVENPNSRRELEIVMPDELKPEQEFTVTIESRDHRPFQATVAVVDEGLLDLTGFQTPDPWEFFFQKMRLGVLTYDLYAQVIGANKGDLSKLFSIGGGEGGSGQLNPVQARRFKPVALFQAPRASDASGRLTAKFKLPEYVGAVKVMAVAAQRQAYGRAEKSVPVRQELMVQPTLPRVLGPGETLALPVEVVTMKPGVGAITVRVRTEGPVAVAGESERTLTLDAPASQVLNFELRTEKAAGPAVVTVEATAGRFASRSRTEIAVRPSSPRVAESTQAEVAGGASVALRVPDRGLEGTNQATLSVHRLPNVDLERRLGTLIHYPYGCIEQTTSSVFPQLYLKSFLAADKPGQERIDANINAGIARLKEFVLPSGGFSYWPGSAGLSGWGTNYAGHFLLAAKKLGYYVPEDMLAGWLRFQQSQALRTEDALIERVYRVYLLALAGEPAQGAMNLLKENESARMTDVERWLLAEAYQLAGAEGAARDLLKSAGLKVADYRETGGTFGSALRDRAVLLEALVLFNRKEEAHRLFESLARELAAVDWYSTQEIGYALLAMGKYLVANEIDYAAKRPRLKGAFILPGGRRVPFDTQDLIVRQKITAGFGQDVSVALDAATTVPKAFVTLDWSGIPLEGDAEAVSRNLDLRVRWLDEDGSEIDPASLPQGTSFWGRITVSRRDQTNTRVENVALAQVLPSGWEIENLRLTGGNLPEWAQQITLAKEDYLDIRDDRLLWFFELHPVNTWDRQNDADYDFLFKVNTISAGSFRLPPTRVEAMYDPAYQATQPGGTVSVRRAENGQ